jgi:ATP citrate (pro-S)-lyase
LFIVGIGLLVLSRNPWVSSSKLVVKPDQLIKRRGKSGLLLLNATWEEVQAWVTPRLGTDIEVEGVKGPLTHFIVEPFVPHSGTDEYYVCIQTNRYGEEVLFYHQVWLSVLFFCLFWCTCFNPRVVLRPVRVVST